MCRNTIRWCVDSDGSDGRQLLQGHFTVFLHPLASTLKTAGCWATISEHMLAPNKCLDWGLGNCPPPHVVDSPSLGQGTSKGNSRKKTHLTTKIKMNIFYFHWSLVWSILILHMRCSILTLAVAHSFTIVVLLAHTYQICSFECLLIVFLYK